MSQNEDYYQILGLKRSADLSEIKKAYHRLALKWHPDKNKSPEAGDLFKKISEAYDILSSPEKKSIYDRFGKEGLQQNHMNFDESHIFDVFNSFFGGAFGPMGPMGQMPPFGGPNMGQFGPFGPRQQQVQMEDLIVTENIKMSEVYTGKKLHKTVERRSMCSSCHGTGSDDGQAHPCTQCKGHKIVQQQTNMGPIITIRTVACPVCQGTGANLKEHLCGGCQGRKTVSETYNFDLEIPIGHLETDVIKMRDEGHYHPETHKRSDLIIRVVIEEHPLFKRGSRLNEKQLSPYDLIMSINLELAESLCGCVKIINLPNGQQISVNVTEIIHDGDVYVIEGHGLPKRNQEKGYLYLIFNVKTVTQLTVDQRKVLWETLTGKPYIDYNKDKNNDMVKPNKI
jgi:DnaJ-class molecular chaperone